LFSFHTCLHGRITSHGVPPTITAAAIQERRSTTKVIDLIEKLQAFDPNADVSVQIETRRFASPVWIGVMDTAGLFDERKQFRLVISVWQPEDYLRPSAAEQQKWESLQRRPSLERSLES